MKATTIGIILGALVTLAAGFFLFGKNTMKPTPEDFAEVQYEQPIGQAAPGLSLWRVQVLWERSWAFPGLDAVGPLPYLVYAKGVPTLKDVAVLPPPLSQGSGRWRPVRIFSAELVSRVQPAPETPQKNDLVE